MALGLGPILAQRNGATQVIKDVILQNRALLQGATEVFFGLGELLLGKERIGESEGVIRGFCSRDVGRRVDEPEQRQENQNPLHRFRET